MRGCATTLYAATRGGRVGMAWVRANGAVGGGGRARSGRVRNDPIRGYAGRPSRDGVGRRERRSPRWWPSAAMGGCATTLYAATRGARAGMAWAGANGAGGGGGERGMGGCATTLYAATRGGWIGMAWVPTVGTAGDGCRARKWEGARRPYTRACGSAGPGRPGSPRSGRLAVVAARGMGGCATTLYAGVRVGWAGMAWVRAVGTAGDGCRARRWEGAQRPYTRRRGSPEPGWPGSPRSARLVMVAERGNRRVRNDPIRGGAGRPSRDGLGPHGRHGW